MQGKVLNVGIFHVGSILIRQVWSTARDVINNTPGTGFRHSPRKSDGKTLMQKERALPTRLEIPGLHF